MPDFSSIVAPAYLAGFDASGTGMSAVMAELGAMPKLARSVAFAVCCHGPTFARSTADRLVPSTDDLEQRIGVLICDLCDHTPAARLAPLLRASVLLRPHVIGLIGTGGHTDLLLFVQTPLADDDDATTRARARTCGMLVATNALPDRLWDLAGHDNISRPPFRARHDTQGHPRAQLGRQIHPTDRAVQKQRSGRGHLHQVAVMLERRF